MGFLGGGHAGQYHRARLHVPPRPDRSAGHGPSMPCSHHMTGPPRCLPRQAVQEGGGAGWFHHLPYFLNAMMIQVEEDEEQRVVAQVDPLVHASQGVVLQDGLAVCVGVWGWGGGVRGGIKLMGSEYGVVGCEGGSGKGQGKAGSTIWGRMAKSGRCARAVMSLPGLLKVTWEPNQHQQCGTALHSAGVHKLMIAHEFNSN